MKNLYKYILCCCAFFPHVLWANQCSQSCEIQDAPAPVLTQYFTNLDEIQSNILSAIADAESENTNDRNITQERNRVMAALNSILSFGEYFGTFDYYVSQRITQDVPAQVDRDHEKIIEYTDRFTQLLETSSRRGQSSIEIENVCEAISDCSFPQNQSVQTVLTAIIQNNQKVAQIFRASILEEPQLAINRDLILVPNDFIGEIEQYYNQDTLTACSSCEEGFLGTIREQIQNISFRTSDYQSGVQIWKDAWAMLMGGSQRNPNRDRQEAQAREEYLRSQGFESETPGIILENQQRFEQAFSSTDPLENQGVQAQTQTDPQRRTFEETLLEAGRNNEGDIPFGELTRVNTQIQNEQEISDSIATLYEDQLPYAFTQDTSSQEIQARIIRMHYELVTAINLFGGNIGNAEELCNRQATGRGRCEY